MNLVFLDSDQKGTVIPLKKFPFLIGRDSQNTLSINDRRVSREHAILELQDERYFLSDLNSTNGTYINGIPSMKKEIKDGDVITFGDTTLIFTSDPEKMSDEELLNEVIISPVPEEIITSEIKISEKNQSSTLFVREEPSTDTEVFNKVQKKFDILCKTVSIVHSGIDENKLFEKLLDLLFEVLNVDRGIILLLNTKTGIMVPKKIKHGNTKSRFLPVTISKTIVDKVLNDTVGVISSDTSFDERFRDSQSIHIYGIKSAMCVPIHHEQEILGIIYLDTIYRREEFSEDDLQIVTAIANQAALALLNLRSLHERQAQKEMKQELRIAREIQELLLPKQVPIINGFDSAFISLPAEEVGGDYIDFIPIDDTHLGLCIADVSGKGIPGAIIMAMFRSILASKSGNTISPSVVLKEVNNMILSDLKQDMYITALYAVFDTKDFTMTIARAGHWPMLKYTPSQKVIEQLKPEGIALGINYWDTGDELNEMTLKLKKDDMILVCTDGIEEAVDDHGEFYGLDRFYAAIKEAPDTASKDIINFIINDIKTFTNLIPQSDDLTLGVIKVTG